MRILWYNIVHLAYSMLILYCRYKIVTYIWRRFWFFNERVFFFNFNVFLFFYRVRDTSICAITCENVSIFLNFFNSYFIYETNLPKLHSYAIELRFLFLFLLANIPLFAGFLSFQIPNLETRLVGRNEEAKERRMFEYYTYNRISEMYTSRVCKEADNS